MATARRPTPQIIKEIVAANPPSYKFELCKTVRFSRCTLAFGVGVNVGEGVVVVVGVELGVDVELDIWAVLDGV